MGHRKQEERDRKRAAAISQRLEQFLPPKKKAVVGTEDIAVCSAVSLAVDSSPEVYSASEPATAQIISTCSAEVHSDDTRHHPPDDFSPKDSSPEVCS